MDAISLHFFALRVGARVDTGAMVGPIVEAVGAGVGTGDTGGAIGTGEGSGVCGVGASVGFWIGSFKKEHKE